MMDRVYRARWCTLFLFTGCTMREDISKAYQFSQNLWKEYIDTNRSYADRTELLVRSFGYCDSVIRSEHLLEDGVEFLHWVRFHTEEVIYELALKNNPKSPYYGQDYGDESTLVRRCWSVVDGARDNDMDVKQINLYMEILLLLARSRDFDAYLLYLERKRRQKERFYLPKRKQFLKHGIIQGFQDMLDDKLDIMSISMPPGTGKAQPLYSKVLTPDGFITMGEVKVGTKVISGTGNVCNVVGVYPQGVRPIYEVTFDDGSKCRCSDEHLWTVQTRDDRVRKNKDGSEKYRTVTLKDMLHNVKIEHGKRCNYSIDYVQRIEFEEKELKLHPYVIGVLIGDGSLTGGNLGISNPDIPVLNRFANLLPPKYRLRHIAAYDYRIVGKEGNYRYAHSIVKDYLIEYGLHGKKSCEKFIPKDYLYSSYENRLELLKGLLDTDGYATPGHAEYATTSSQLAEDVRELVHSLGGYCSVSKRKAGYRKNGEYIRCKDCYTLMIEFPTSKSEVFYLPRKKDIYKPKRERLIRFITDITYVGEEECQCILIDDPSHLYITDDYIITHNTTALKFFTSGVIGWNQRSYSLFFSHSSDITRMYYDGALDICTNEEYCWNEIFYDAKITNTNAKMGQFNVGSYRPFPSLQTSSKGAENSGKVRVSPDGYLLVDDLIGSQEEALNIKQLDKLWENTYTVDARQRKLDGAKEIHLSTRWSVHDIIGRLQRLYEGNDRVRFIAIPDIDPETGESNFDYEVDGFTVEFFNDIALAMDELSYKALYKSEPMEREGLLYHEEDLRRYLSMPDKEPDAILGVCDVKGKGTDYMFLPVMYQYGEDFYLADAICDDNADYEVQYAKLTDILANYKVQACEFESNAGGDRVAAEVQKRLIERGCTCTITTHPTETNKETRIIVNAEWVKKRVLFRDKSLYSPKDDYGVMMNWLLCYSTVGKNNHDDVPDGLANFRLYVTGMQPQLAKVEAIFNPFRSRGNY